MRSQIRSGGAGIPRATLNDGREGGLVVVDGIPSGTLVTQTKAITAVGGANAQRLTFDPPINGAFFSVRKTDETDATKTGENVLVSVGNHTAVVGKAWLDEANSGNRFEVQVGKDISKTFSAPASYVDITGVGTTIASTITVGGVI